MAEPLSWQRPTVLVSQRLGRTTLHNLTRGEKLYVEEEQRVLRENCNFLPSPLLFPRELVGALERPGGLSTIYISFQGIFGRTRLSDWLGTPGPFAYADEEGREERESILSPCSLRQE